MKESIWYRQLGFYNNPFSIKPAAFHDELLGCNAVSEVIRSILDKGIVFVEGHYGNGKTTLLRHILNRFGGRGKVIYFNCARIGHALDIKKLLNERYGFIGRLLNLKPKDMILLLDEAQYLGKSDYEALLHYYSLGHFRSIVFVGKQCNNDALPERLRQILRLVSLGQVSEKDAVSIIRKRIGNFPMISDEIIKMVFRMSDYNVRQLLKNCELLCRYAVENETSLTEELVSSLLSTKEVVQKPEEKEEEVKEKRGEVIEEHSASKPDIEEEKPKEQAMQNFEQKNKNDKSEAETKSYHSLEELYY